MRIRLSPQTKEFIGLYKLFQRKIVSVSSVGFILIWNRLSIRLSGSDDNLFDPDPPALVLQTDTLKGRCHERDPASFNVYNQVQRDLAEKNS